jgi:hypothetical protein
MNINKITLSWLGLLVLSVLLLLSVSTLSADTGDVIDDFLPAATGTYNCGGYAAAVWADVDEDGTHDTQIVFTTIEKSGDAGESQVTRDDPDGKWFFFSFIDGHCGGASPYVGRGRFAIRFVDILAPGFVWDNPASWTYKPITALSLRVSHDACYNWDDPRYSNPSIFPYLGVQAYGELNQTDLRTPFSESPSGGWTEYRFSDPAGIKELYISTDFCENVIDDLMLFQNELTDTLPTGSAGLVLLFDTSGSMNWSHTGAVGVPDDEKRLSMAKDAAIPIVEIMNEHRTDDASFAITQFPAQPWLPGTCNGQIITPMSLINDANTATATGTTIPGLTASGSTPLLTGVSTALSTFVDQDRRAVVLLSDGYHNCPHGVDATDAEVTSVIADALASSTSIYSIGFGRPSDVDHPLLDRLATNTGGVFYDVTGPLFDPHTWNPRTALAEAYVTILGDSLGLEVAADPRGVIKAGSTVNREIAVSEHDTKVSFYLSWATRKTEQLGLTVHSSDGLVVSEIDAGVSVKQGATYTTLTVDKTFLNLTGKVGTNPWRLEIDATKLSDTPQEYYQYSVLMSSALKMKVNAEAATNSTGDTITVTAQLSIDNKAVTGLNDVFVSVNRPEEGPGNWFAVNKVSPEELDKIPAIVGKEVLSPISRKFRFLRDIRKIPLPGRTEPASLPLYDDGTHGDVTANDGTYTNQYSDTVKEGTYGFRFRATGKSSSIASFQREFHIDKYLGVRVSGEGLSVDISQLADNIAGLSRLKVTATPKDKLGNYLGPRYAKSIQFDTPFGRLVGDVQDNLDGSYTQIIEIPASTQEVMPVSIRVGGEEVNVEWKPSIQDETEELLNWLTYLLIVMLFVLLSILYLKRRV